MQMVGSVHEDAGAAVAPPQEAPDTGCDKASPSAESKRYRILGAHHQNSATSGGESDGSDDPMAWADLEVFGGARKTLAKKKPRVKLSPEEVRQQLEELHELDGRMALDGSNTRAQTNGGVADTIAWLKRHNDSVAARGGNQTRKRSSTFVRSVLGFFSRSSSHSDGEEGGAAEAEETAGETASAELRAPWGQAELQVDWTEVGFCLLNQPILEDMSRVRAFIDKDELMSVSPHGLVALSKWLQLFDQHVRFVIGMKEYLLEERTMVAGVGYKVTTLYDQFDEALAVALTKMNDEKRDLGNAILAAFVELEAILKDELVAVKDVISQTLSEVQEYTAISTLFSELSEDDASGVVVAKLLGWMKNNMKEKDVRVFLELFSPNVQSRIAGEWMRQYASFLHLLDEFSVNYDSSLSYFT